MHFYRATLAYKGTRYSGWQVQPTETTVQGELNRALETIAKSSDVRTIGSGRTDAGVHAQGQVVRMEIPFSIEPKGLMRGLNSHLPDDIRVLACEISHADFHPTFGAESKYYSYFFQLHEDVDPFLHDMLATYSFPFDEMRAREAAQCFVGTHDFLNFYTEGTEVSSSVRTVFACDLLKHQPGTGPVLSQRPFYEIRVHGNGFLKQMVRLMVGSIWNVARGKIDAELISQSLCDVKKSRIAAVAPPEGLYLMRVIYPSN